jgi:shikimate dehydrogenase
MLTPNEQTRVVGIVGDPVAHSLSPRMHNAAFEALGLNWRYLAFRVRADALAQALRGLAALGLAGANVTIPHKEAAVALVDELDHVARRIGAINTIRVADGRLEGFNTDAAGLLDALTEDGGATIRGRRCLVIGAGGGGRAAAFALSGAAASQVTILNRTVSRARGLAEMVSRDFPLCRAEAGDLAVDTVERHMESAEVVVHTTTATMSAAMGGGGGRGEWLAAVARGLRPGMVVHDMVYTPRWTDLLNAAQESGAVAVSGLSLLVRQGAKSFELWTGRPAPIEVMRQAVEEQKR